MTYFIILCGGSGTRLWPLSRKNKPKQLLPFLNDKSLLEQTIERIGSISNKENIGIVTTQDQAKLVAKELKAPPAFTIEEPSPRNTAPAILLGCLEIAKRAPDTVIAVLTSDHFIPETEKFCSYLQKAIDFASQHDRIVTLGLMPTRPATGYGYIQAKVSNKLGSSPILNAGSVYDVKRFHEKPNLEKAEEYVAHGDMFWNLGMFIGKATCFINEYKKHAPAIFDAVSKFVETGDGYENAPTISIDYAIMEKSKNISVMPCDFIWNDVGNLDVFLSIQQKSDGIIPSCSQIINVDGKRNIAKVNKKIVTFIGLDDVCIIEDGDVLVVAKRSEIEKVREARSLLEKERREELL